jgi:RNA polymerase sigma factor (sigma-70 family)
MNTGINRDAREELSDAELVTACLDRPEDRETVRLFVLRFSRIALQTVRWTFLRYGRADLGNAPDVVQDVFVGLFDNDRKILGSYDAGKAQFATWFITIARNKAVNFLKKRRDVSLDAQDDVADEVSETLDAHMEYREQKDFISRAVLTLTEKERLFYHLYFEELAPPDTCAAILGTGTDTVYSQKAKVIGKIRDYIRHHYHSGTTP